MSRIHYDWSKLCPDLLRSIFESLTAKDFHRSRIVCSNWYTVSTTCKRPLYPWRIQFKENTTLLFDPVEEESYEIEHPGIDISKTYVMASCSNWLLIVDSRLNFYLLNVFTRERINLPSIESSLLGEARFEGGEEDKWEHFVKRTDIFSSKKPAVLWVNERTGDYVVAWSYKQHYLFSYKKGDDSWWDLDGRGCIDLGCKEKNLYVYTSSELIKILDLSGDCPEEVVEGNPYRNRRFRFTQPGEYIWKRKLAITNSGEVLIVVSVKGLGEKRFFYIFRMNLGSGIWERVDSLGGEMLIFGHGFTIRAPVKEIDVWGIKNDSICFVDDDLWPRTNRFYPNLRIKGGVFDYAASTITWPEPLDASSFMKSFLFVPGYA